MKKLYDVAVKVGAYEKNGETKNKYENIGSIMESVNDQGEKSIFMFMKRTFNPAGVPFRDGSSDIIISLFKPRNDDPHPADGGNDGAGW